MERINVVNSNILLYTKVNLTNVTAYDKSLFSVQYPITWQRWEINTSFR